MFINIWDEENTTIKINKFDKKLLSNNESFYREEINSCNKEYGIKIDGYKIEFKNSDSYCFNGKLYFSLLLDCFAFLITTAALPSGSLALPSLYISASAIGA